MSDSITELNKLSSYDSATGNISDQDGGMIGPALIIVGSAIAHIMDPTQGPRSNGVTSAVTNAGSAVLPTIHPAGTASGRDAGTFRNLFTNKKTKHNTEPDNKEPSLGFSSDWAKTLATAAVSATAAKILNQKTRDVGTKITSVPPNTTSVGTNTQSVVPIFKSKLEKLKFLIDEHFEKIKELI